MRRRRLFLLVALSTILISCARSSAEEAEASRVVVFGDSMTAWYSPTDWPALVQKQRADLQVCSNGVPGRTTVDGLAQFDDVMRYTSGFGRVTDVVFLLGINDLQVLGAAPLETAQRLRQLAAKARAWGAREWILTPAPAIKIPLHRELPAWSFSRDVGNLLMTLNGVGPVYNVLDLRDEFARRVLWSSCSTDGLHPTGLECRQVIADFVARALP